jgi:hypothetical protein
MAVDLSQYVKLIQNPTSTPGVVNTTLWVDPNAPAEVQNAVSSARSAASDLGGIGGLAPANLYSMVERMYGAQTGQNATMTGPTAAPVAGQNQYALETPIPTDWQRPEPAQTMDLSQLVDSAAPTLQQVTNQMNNAPTTGPVAQPATPTLPSPTMTQTPTLPALPAQPTQSAVPTLPTLPTGSLPSTGVQTGSYITPENAQAYLNANPQVAQEIINNAGASMNGRTPAQWLVDHINQTEAAEGGGRFTNELNNFARTNNLPQAAPNAGTAQIPNVGVTGGNYNLQEAGNQTGNYASTGTTAQSQTGQQQTQQSQTSAQTGTTTDTGTTTGTTTQSGTTTGQTQVTTPFDIASLIEGQLGGVQASDAARSAFLTDFMNTGGTGFNAQVDAAIRQSLSGPQMTGTGDNARARIAGAAASDIARNNALLRLGAAQQLAGPTGLGSMVQATSPLYGQSTTGTTAGTTGTTQNTQNTQTQQLQSAMQNLSNTLDFQQLIGQETQAGTASGSSASAGAGQVPEGQPVKTGGCVVCTAYVALGQMHPGAVRRAVEWKKRMWGTYGVALDGYLLYGPVLAKMVLRDGLFARLFKPTARAILYHECHLSAPTRFEWRLLPYLQHAVFNLISWPVGAISRLVGTDTGVRDASVRQMLNEQKLSVTI